MKGFKMAPPFIAGIALGAGLIAAYNNKDKIKKSVLERRGKRQKDILSKDSRRRS